MFYGKKIVALCTSRINDIQVNRFVNELNTDLIRSGFALFVYNMSLDAYWNEDAIPAESSVYDLMDYDVIDIIVILHEKIKSNTVTDRIVAAANSKGVPVIVVDGEHENAVCIGFDYEKGFEKIVRHVIEDHHVRRPHFMAGVKGNYFSERRLEVFKKVIADNQIPFQEDMISYGDFWATPASQAAQCIVDSGHIPEAVICANDVMAVKVCDVFAENGIRVPEDVIVTGFDGVDEAFICSPGIATVSCNMVTLASAVSDAIEQLADGQQTGPHILVEPELYTNESCGCAKYEEPFFKTLQFNHNFYRYQDDVKVLIDVSAKMQMCNSIEQAAECLNDETYMIRDRILHNVCCVINKSCLSENRNYFSDSSVTGFEKEMYLFYDGHSGKYGMPVAKGETFPGLEYLLAMQCPIIYSALVFMDKPIGYVCFSFGKYDIMDYTSILQIANVLSMGLGGYIINRHQKYLYHKLEELYRTDALTKLYNRYGFQTELEKYKSNPQYIGKPVTIIACDLDSLKYINDNFGHDAGDFALSSTADVLRKSFPEDSLCVRHGGDEMLAVVFGDYDPQKLTEKLNQNFDQLNRTVNLEYKIFASSGYYQTSLTTDFDLENALKQADSAMYINKRNRKKDQTK